MRGARICQDSDVGGGGAKVRPGDPEAGLRAWAESIPIGRIIEPSEVASLVLFLASDSAAAITGSCHLVDGAVLAKRGI